MNKMTPTEPTISAFATAWVPAGAMSDAVTQFWTTLAGLNTEFLRFAQTRISHNSDAAGRLARCQSLPDAIAVESEWLRTAFNDWSEEAKRLSEINGRLMNCLALRAGPDGQSVAG